MPFLNCVERVNQNALCLVIPNLFQEVQNDNLICDSLETILCKMDPCHYMEKQEPKTALDKYLIKLPCQSAASGLELQFAWEYWPNQEGTVRAAVLYELDPNNSQNYLQIINAPSDTLQILEVLH